MSKHLSNKPYRDKTEAQFFSKNSPDVTSSGAISSTPFRKVENNEDVFLEHQPNRTQFKGRCYQGNGTTYIDVSGFVTGVLTAKSKYFNSGSGWVEDHNFTTEIDDTNKRITLQDGHKASHIQIFDAGVQVAEYSGCESSSDSPTLFDIFSSSPNNGVIVSGTLTDFYVEDSTVPYSHLNEKGYTHSTHINIGNGSNALDILDDGSLDITGSISVFCWVKTNRTSTVGPRPFISRDNMNSSQTTGCSWELEHSFRGIRVVISSDGNVVGSSHIDCSSPSNSLDLDKWLFIGFTFDSTESVVTDRVKIYLDSASQSLSYSASNDITTIHSQSIPVSIGKYFGFYKNYWTAEDFEVKHCIVNDSVYTPTEINKMYNNGIHDEFKLPANYVMYHKGNSFNNPSFSTTITGSPFIENSTYPVKSNDLTQDILGNNIQYKNKLLPRAQLVSRSITLNGTDQWTRSSSISSIQPTNLILSCKIKIDSYGGSNKHFLSCFADTSNYFALGHDTSGFLRLVRYNGSQINTLSSLQMSLNTWYDVSIERISDTVVKFKLDDKEEELTIASAPIATDDYTFYIGSFSGTSGFLEGSICDAKMYDGGTLYRHYPLTDGAGLIVNDVSINEDHSYVREGGDWEDQEVFHYKFFNDHENLEPETVGLYRIANDLSNNDVYIFDRFIKRIKKRFGLILGEESLKTIFGALYITSAPTSTSNVHLDDVINPVTFNRISATTGTLSVTEDVGIGLDTLGYRASTDRSISEVISNNNANLTAENFEMFCNVNVAQGITDGNQAGLLGNAGSTSCRLSLGNTAGQLYASTSFMTSNFGATSGNISSELGMYSVKRVSTDTYLFKEGELLGSYNRASSPSGQNFAVADMGLTTDLQFSGRIGIWGFADPTSTFDHVVLKEEYDVFLTELQANTVVTDDPEIKKIGYDKTGKYNLTEKVKLPDIPQLPKKLRGSTIIPNILENRNTSNRTNYNDKTGLIITSEEIPSIDLEREDFIKGNYLDEYLGSELGWHLEFYRRYKDFNGTVAVLRRISDGATYNLTFPTNSNWIDWNDPALLTFVDGDEVEVIEWFNQLPATNRIFTSATAPNGQGPTIYENGEWIKHTGTDFVTMDGNGSDEFFEAIMSPTQNQQTIYQGNIAEYKGSGNNYAQNFTHNTFSTPWTLMQAYPGGQYRNNVTLGVYGGTRVANNPSVNGYQEFIDYRFSSQNGEQVGTAIASANTGTGLNRVYFFRLRGADVLCGNIKMSASWGLIANKNNVRLEMEKIINTDYNL